MSHRLCGRKETKNNRSDPYADGTGEKSSVHKCQNLAVLDRTLLSIRLGSFQAAVLLPVNVCWQTTRLKCLSYSKALNKSCGVTKM